MSRRTLALLTPFALALSLASCGATGAANRGASGPAPGGEQATGDGDGDADGEGEGTPDARHDPHASDCGSSVSDWCAARAGDPCGEHPDTETCRADARCEGRPYTGESLAACALDARCFASNCPTVGCISRCETLEEAACEQHGYRCSWNGSQCERAEACRR